MKMLVKFDCFRFSALGLKMMSTALTAFTNHHRYGHGGAKIHIR